MDLEPQPGQTGAESVALGAKRVGQAGEIAVGQAQAKGEAGWKGAPEVYVRNCLTERTAATRSAGPVTQPIFQPVIENVLPADPIDRVRDRIPGSVASGTCGRS